MTVITLLTNLAYTYQQLMLEIVILAQRLRKRGGGQGPPGISKIMYIYLILPLEPSKIRGFLDFCCVCPPPGFESLRKRCKGPSIKDVSSEGEGGGYEKLQIGETFKA